MYTPCLYDLVVSHVLFWPSLTVQWLPDRQLSEDKDSIIQCLLLGTHTGDGEQNYLIVAKVCVPIESEQTKIQDINIRSSNKISIQTRIPVDNEINKVQYMPQNHNIVAVKTSSPHLGIFDISKVPESFEPIIRLTGQSEEGCGLAWNPQKSGVFISVSEDKSICLWDIESGTSGDGSLTAKSAFMAHKSTVEAVSWHPKHENIFCSAGDDKVILWDIRTENPLLEYCRHSAEVYDVSFNPFNEWIFATASADHKICLWDVRNQSNSLYSLIGHDSQVYQISWAPFCESILASFSCNRKIFIWDLSKINSEYRKQQVSDLDKIPELMFIHGGHVSRILDFNWNPSENWSMASVDESNIVQIWQIAKHIYQE